jgi:glycerate kinase
MIVAVDVQNPLLGPRGATRIYGPQKGLKPRDYPAAEQSFRQMALLVKRQHGRDLGLTPGAGAAGGLGFGFLAFLDSRLIPGFELFAKEAQLEKKLRSADVVLTGEGAIDRSSFMGKGAGCVARLCRKRRVPCFGLAGDIASCLGRPPFFDRVMTLTELTTIQEAKRNPAKWLQRLTNRLASQWPVTLGAPAQRVNRSRRKQG